MISAQLLFRARHELAEGPVWHEDALWWVDIEGRTINRGDLETGVATHTALPFRVGAMVPCDDGRWLTANERGFGFFDPGTGILENLDSFRLEEPRIRMNDGKCDPRGRFLAGTMHEDLAAGTAKLYSIERTREPRILVEGSTISNGLGWSPDGTQFYYIDTVQRRIDVFDYDLESGTPSRRRPLAFVSEKDGWPDGMAVDERGNLWVALWGGSAVDCYDGRTGQLVDRIACPVSQPSSCCFGGKAMDQLFITSAWQGLSAEQLQREPLAGSVFIAKPGICGLPVTTFRIKDQST